MKKTLVFLFALFLVAAFTVPATAELENIFGGYWRTRWWTQQNWNGDENVRTSDYSLVDTRTRLYYTAKFSDDFKFVNRFEYDASWGDNNYGDIGADGVRIEIKSSYVDFNTGMVNWTVGVQGTTLGRGFIFSDDFAGLIARMNFSEMFSVPVFAITVSEQDAGGAPGSFTQGGGPDIYTGGGAFTGGYFALPAGFYAAGDADVHIYGGAPLFRVGDNMTFIVPLAYLNTAGGTQSDNDWYYIGVDFDMKLDALGIWASAIYNGGEVDSRALGGVQSDPNSDVKGYLLAVGLDGSFGNNAWWFQSFYATGQDPNASGTDIDAYVPIGLPGGSGSSYYWAEIMGLGVFDNQPSAASPGDHITNILAAGVGATWGFTDKMKLKTDLWYAKLNEPWISGGSDDLGFEIDLNLIINVVENMNLEVIAAYQAAGDAVISTASSFSKNQDDPYLVGTRLSFSF